jgi:PAS domain S-box-containing protein
MAASKHKRTKEALLEVNRTLDPQAGLQQSQEEVLKIFVKSVPVGVAMFDRDMRYLQASDRWCADHSIDSSQVFGRSHYELSPDLPQRWKEMHRRGLAGETLCADEDRWEREGASDQWFRWEIRPWMTSSGTIGGILIFAEDITRRKQAEEALRESEGRFRLVANAAPVMIWMSGTDKLCNYFNERWLEFTGRSIEAELGNGWTECVHPEDFKRCLDTYIRAFDRHDPFKMEYRLRRYDGDYRWMLDIGVPRYNAEGSLAGYIGSCIDVTDRKLAEEALTTVSRRLIEAHEEERTWIARELHDDVNQRIGLVAVELEGLKRNPPKSTAEVKGRVQQIYERISDLASDIEALSHRLHSSKLEYLGIAAAARSFCKELSEQQKVQVNFSCADIPKNLPHEISLCLFRVLQEALKNAVEHSGARSFTVGLRGESDGIRLTVSDVGVGFDPKRAMKREGLGLISMQERIHLVRGEISIESQPSRGTTIRARVPFSARSDCMRPVRAA